MKKEEALKQYSDGLEKAILLNDRILKDKVKLLCEIAFSCGWDAHEFQHMTKAEQEGALKKWGDLKCAHNSPKD